MSSEKIYRLEDIKAWQLARKILVRTYKVTDGFPKSEEYIHKKHMRECARNVPGNIGEGFGRFHYQECIQFYRIARGSVCELKSDYYTSFDLGYIQAAELNEVLDMIEEEIRLLNGLINSCREAKSNIR